MSKKVQYIVKLVGITADNIKATTQQANLVRAFVDADKKFQVTPGSRSFPIVEEAWQKEFAIGIRKPDDHYVVVNTNGGTYLLEKSLPTINLWTGLCRGIKVHFTKKKIVGKLIYWAPAKEDV